LRYVRLRPPADAVAAVIPPKVVPETPKPIVPPVVATPQQATAAPQPNVTASGPGSESGNSGTAGSGPGSLGGTGTGVGSGRGSETGPGTGGGPAANYPPSPTQFFLPPLPAPASVKGYQLVAWFDVDEKGHATLLGFNPSRDSGYNRKLREVLLSLRFRPGARADGTPVRDTVDIRFIF
jgi:protein TonB